MNSKTRLFLSLITLGAVSAPIAAQSYLPPNQTATVRAQLEERNLKETLREALNSEGDTITLDLFVEVSSGLELVKVGSSSKFLVEVEKTEKGFEVSMGFQAAASVGVDALSNVEASVKAGAGGKVIFAFDSDENASRGMRMLAIARMLKLDRAMKAGLKVLNTARDAANKANRRLWSAVQKREIGEKVERVMKKMYEAGSKFLQTFYKPISRARARLTAARAKVAELGRKVDSLRVGRGKLLAKMAYVIAKKFVDTLELAFAKIDAAYRRALAAMESKRAKWLAQAAEVRGLIEAEAQKRKEWTWHMEAYENAKNIYAMLTNPAQVTGNMRSAVEFQTIIGASGQVSLGVPGVSLGNLGLSAGVAANVALTMRWDFPNKSTTKTVLTIGANMNTSITGKAGVGLGLGAAIDNELRIESKFERYGGKGQKFTRSGLRALAAVDLSLETVVGVGIMRVQGVGRTMTLEISGPQWEAARKRWEIRRRTVPTASLVRQLRSTTATYTVQDRWIAGGRAAIGIDLIFVSFTIGGSAIWADRGVAFRVGHGRTGDFLNKLRSSSNLRSIADQLRGNL